MDIGEAMLSYIMRPVCYFSYLAVGHRIECKDHIGVYSVQPWQELSKFRSRTNDMVSLQWTPGGTHLVAQDSQLQYRLMIYTPAGEVSGFLYLRFNCAVLWSAQVFMIELC